LNEAKRSFYEYDKINGKTVILRKRILNLREREYAFGVRKRILEICKGLRVDSLKTWRAILQNVRPKGYPSTGAVGSGMDGWD